MGPSSLCPTGVLPLLDVIAATTGYDLAVVEGGTLTWRDRCAQTVAQSRPKQKKRVCCHPGVDRAVCDLERVVSVSQLCAVVA